MWAAFALVHLARINGFHPYPRHVAHPDPTCLPIGSPSLHANQGNPYHHSLLRVARADMACFGRVHLLKVNRRRRVPSPPKGRDPFCYSGKIWWPARPAFGTRRRDDPGGLPPAACYSAGNGRTSLNYERFNCNNLTRCYWSWNYRGCWHQTCPPIVTRCGI